MRIAKGTKPKRLAVDFARIALDASIPCWAAKFLALALFNWRTTSPRPTTQLTEFGRCLLCDMPVRLGDVGSFRREHDRCLALYLRRHPEDVAEIIARAAGEELIAAVEVACLGLAGVRVSDSARAQKAAW